MENSRYDIYLDDEVAAENMDFHTALMLIKAMDEAYWAEPELAITLKRRNNGQED